MNRIGSTTPRIARAVTAAAFAPYLSPSYLIHTILIANARSRPAGQSRGGPGRRARRRAASAAGSCLLVGFTHTDGDDQLRWMADKVVGLRIFPDDDDKMNRSIADAGGSLLVVSQFTLYGDAVKGRRPSFVDAARPEVASPLFDRFVALLRASGTSRSRRASSARRWRSSW